MITTLLLLACRSDPEPPPDTVDTAPTLIWTLPTGDTGVPVTGSAEALAHGVRIRVSAPDSAALDVACTSPNVPEEDHRLIAPAALSHDVIIQGLLADTTYDCTLAVDGQSLHASVVTPPLAILTPWSIDEHDSARSYGAYTLFNLGDGDSNSEPHQLILVDPQGQVRWVKIISDEFPDCDATILDDQTLIYGGGQGVPPTIETLAGEVLFQAPQRDFDERYHHHAERLPSGDILTMTQAQDTAKVLGVPQTWDGFVIERIAPDGSITWSWSSQSATDSGVLPIPPIGATDPWHANSVSVDDQGITYVNLRQKAWMLAIDPTGEVLWRLGPNGDFALIDDKGNALPDSEWFWGPHAPEHHGDRILFYDNGYRRPGSYTSRALELVIDRVAMTATPTWSWTEEGWYEPIWGDIDELPEGRYLLARGHCGGCNEDLRSQVVEMDRGSGDVLWRLRFDDTRWGIYRAQRIDGCDLFNNERYCL